MIVIGVDVHKHELTAVAVDELGRQLDALATTAACSIPPFSWRALTRPPASTSAFP
jgi:hypothetical protein